MSRSKIMLVCKINDISYLLNNVKLEELQAIMHKLNNHYYCKFFLNKFSNFIVRVSNAFEALFEEKCSYFNYFGPTETVPKPLWL